jgi:hypothetical protein
MVPVGLTPPLVELSVMLPVPALMSPAPVRLPPRLTVMVPLVVLMLLLSTTRSFVSLTVSVSPSPLIAAVRLLTSVLTLEVF